MTVHSDFDVKLRKSIFAFRGKINTETKFDMWILMFFKKLFAKSCVQLARNEEKLASINLWGMIIDQFYNFVEDI